MLPYTQLMKNNFVTCLARITLENKHSMLQMLSQTCHLCNHTSFLHRHVRGAWFICPIPTHSTLYWQKSDKGILGKSCVPQGHHRMAYLSRGMPWKAAPISRDGKNCRCSSNFELSHSIPLCLIQGSSQISHMGSSPEHHCWITLFKIVMKKSNL